MKLTRSAAALLAVLVLGVPFSFSGARSSGPKASFAFGWDWLSASSNLAYSYTYSEIYYDELATLRDDLSGRGVPGFMASAGFFVSPRLEAFGAVASFRSARHQGTVVVRIPDMYYYNAFATDSASQERKVAGLDLWLGLKYHLAPGSRLDPYLGLGACFASSTVRFLSDAVITSDYGAFGDYHVTMSQLQFQDVKARGLGGFGIAGLEWKVGGPLSLFAEGLLKIARREVLHPYSVRMERPMPVGLDLGGLVLSTGLKVGF